MAGTLVGVLLIVAGLLTALSGPYSLAVLIALVAGYALYVGFQPDAVNEVLTILEGTPLIQDVMGVLDMVPFLPKVVAGIISTAFILWWVALAWGVIGGLLPAAYGLMVGLDTFGESVLALVPALLGFLFTLGLIAFAVVAVPALVGGVLTVVGIRFAFAIGPEPRSPFTDAATILQDLGLPGIVADTVSAIGSIVQSPLLLGLTILVSIVGLAGHYFVFTVVQQKVAA